MKSCIATLFMGLFLLESLAVADEQKTDKSTVTATQNSGASTPGLLPVSSVAEGRRMEISDEQLEKALKDKRYLQRQLKCTLGEATCDPVGRRLKTLAPLVLRGSCPQCSPTEMRQIQKTLLYIQRHYPKEWAKMIRTYQ